MYADSFQRFCFLFLRHIFFLFFPPAMLSSFELRFAGPQNMTCDSLPAVFTFDPFAQREVLIGREGELIEAL
jgi:hypothetical protein